MLSLGVGDCRLAVRSGSELSPGVGERRPLATGLATRLATRREDPAPGPPRSIVAMTTRTERPEERLTPEGRRMLQESLDQLERGEIYTDEEVRGKRADA